MHQPEKTKENRAERYPLEKLVQQAFAKLSCPALSNGLYAELEQLVKQAYNLGKDTSPVLSTEPTSQ